MKTDNNAPAQPARALDPMKYMVRKRNDPATITNNAGIMTRFAMIAHGDIILKYLATIGNTPTVAAIETDTLLARYLFFAPSAFSIFGANNIILETEAKDN